MPKKNRVGRFAAAARKANKDAVLLRHGGDDEPAELRELCIEGGDGAVILFLEYGDHKPAEPRELVISIMEGM